MKGCFSHRHWPDRASVGTLGPRRSKASPSPAYYGRGPDLAQEPGPSRAGGASRPASRTRPEIAIL
jgi:hypothetical protein